MIPLPVYIRVEPFSSDSELRELSEETGIDLQDLKTARSRKLRNYELGVRIYQWQNRWRR